ncbi:MAG: N-acetylmuramoyl-L-alanine amidase [Rhodoglobus sp.]
MYLPFALAALLALTGLTGPAAWTHDGPTAAQSALARSGDSVPLAQGSAIAAKPSAQESTAPDGLAVEKIDIVVPPVAPGEPATTTAPPAVQSAPDEVVADQLVAPARVESEVVQTAGFQTMGMTWPEGAAVDGLGGQVRTKTDGQWSGWADLVPSDDAPDAGSSDATHAVRGGTDSVWIGDADAVQLAFAATPQGGPDGLSLALIGSDEKAAPANDAVVGSAATGKATVHSASYASGRVAAATVPAVIPRAQWGAPAQVCTPDVASKLIGAAVHHTADQNDYSTVAEAMQRIRNDAAYHINSRGWCDIGYNFVVDKWGNIYEGRANSMNAPVVGVHAGGFNTGTVGVAMLGTYDSAPSAATQQAVAQIIGWRLGQYDVDPSGSMLYATGEGENSRFANETVSLPRVFGHRDVAFTACPGQGGWNALPTIRAIASEVARTTPRLNYPPIGNVDSIVTSSTGLTVSGWALDPDTSASNQAHIYIDGVGVAIIANLSRPDVAAVYGKGDKHGFTHTRALSKGEHAICVYSIDLGGGPNTVLTCRTITVGPPVLRNPPIGSLDVVSVSNTAITLSGWSLDPDTTGKNEVNVYIDGIGASLWADDSRPDVGRAFGRGDLHGFTYSAPATPGRHDLCVYALNTGLGANLTLGCRTVVVPDQLPIGAVDSVVTSNSGIYVSGWTLDRDFSGSNQAHVYIDGIGVALVADQSRPDVGAAFGRGNLHGFSRMFPVAPGAHAVCIFAINTSLGANVTLTCRNVLVPDRAPIGVVDSIVATRGTLTFAGWTLDPDTSASNQAHIYIDGVGVALIADQTRPDVAAAFNLGSKHGFTYTAHVAAGTRSVCVYGINTVAGPNTVLTCRNVLVP